MGEAKELGTGDVDFLEHVQAVGRELFKSKRAEGKVILESSSIYEQ